MPEPSLAPVEAIAGAATAPVIQPPPDPLSAISAPPAGSVPDSTPVLDVAVIPRDSIGNMTPWLILGAVVVIGVVVFVIYKKTRATPVSAVEIPSPNPVS